MVTLIVVWRDSATYHRILNDYLANFVRGDYSVSLPSSLKSLKWRIGALRLLEAFALGCAIDSRNRNPRWLAVSAMVITIAVALALVFISP